MFDLFVINSSVAVALFIVSFVRGKGMIVPAIVASEFVFSNGLVESLLKLERTGGLFFYMNYTLTGLFSLLIAAFIAIYFTVMNVSKSAVIVSVLYFLYGVFNFLIVVESLPINNSYPFDIVGLYNYIQYINNTFCVLILIATGYGVVGGNGKRIRNFFNLRSSYAGGNKFMLFNREGCGKNGDDEQTNQR
jgi:hypothetical protein